MTKNILFLFLCFVFLSGRSTVCTNSVSGNWTTVGTWNCGHVPVCGDTVIIKVSTTVSLTAHSNYYTGCASCATAACNTTCTAKMLIVINGNLWFSTGGGKLSLPCCSKIFVNGPSGAITPEGNGSSSVIDICNSQVWKAGDGVIGPGSCFPTPCSSLPIELIAFTGNLEVKVVFLNWKTITESNNNYFELEKSADAFDFSKIATLKSLATNGNSNGLLSYNYIDNDLKHPLYYYRLKQVDFDGSFKYTNIISVKIYSPELKIYPNPSSGKFWIDVPTAKTNQQVDVKIYDQLSNEILNSNYTIVNDNITGARVEISPSKPLAKGIYVATIIFDGIQYKMKLVIN